MRLEDKLSSWGLHAIVELGRKGVGVYDLGLQRQEGQSHGDGKANKYLLDHL